jgi:type I restriction enzyme S subunit
MSRFPEVKLKHIAQVILGKMLDDKQASDKQLRPYLRSTNVQWDFVDTTDIKEMWFSKDEMEKLRLSSGDLIVSEGGEVGRTAMWRNDLDECYIQNAVHKIVCGKDMLPRFLFWQFRYLGRLGFFESIVEKVSIAHLTREKLQVVRFAKPDLELQELICSYLDSNCENIDRFIANKKRLIELFEEQRRAIVSRAVTRGIREDVPMKPSGLDWLGEIPSSWQISRVKHILRPVDLRSTTGEEQLLSLRMNRGLVVHANQGQGESRKEALIGYKIVHPNQLVVNRMQAGNGLIFESELSGLVSPDYSTFDIKPGISPAYLASLFRSEPLRVKFRQESKGLGTGTSGFLRLYDDKLLTISIPIPSFAEQHSILAHVSERTKSLKAAIAVAEREIDLIEEFRTTLISEVVTGKREIRPQAGALGSAT